MLLGIAELAYFTSVGVTIYTLPLFTTGPIGSDEAGAGLAFGAFGITALLFRPVRRPAVGPPRAAPADAVRRAAGRCSACCCSRSWTPSPRSSRIRLLQGVAEAAFFVAGFALLADIAPPARMGEALSYNSLGLYLGLAPRAAAR